MKPVQVTSDPVMKIHDLHNKGDFYAFLKNYKKTQVWGVSTVGKKGGKWEGLMRKQGVAKVCFPTQRNL